MGKDPIIKNPKKSLIGENNKINEIPITAPGRAYESDIKLLVNLKNLRLETLLKNWMPRTVITIRIVENKETKIVFFVNKIKLSKSILSLTTKALFIMKVNGIIREKKTIVTQTAWIKSNLKFELWNLWSELEFIFISYLYLFVKNFSVKKKIKTTKNKKTDSNDAVLISARAPQALKIPLVYVLTPK